MKITIYTSEHCVSCREAIQYLHERYIPFQQLDVGYDKHNFDEMLRLGGIATPFIMVGNQKLHSFDRNQLEAILKNGFG